MLDSQNRDPFNRAGIVNEVPEYVLKKYPVALFNVPAGNGTRETAFSCGFHGILLTTDSPKHFKKAIAAILAGELWYPRKAMAACILKNSQQFVPTDKKKPSLTTREMEI